jgi:hypothetical protein
MSIIEIIDLDFTYNGETISVLILVIVLLTIPPFIVEIHAKSLVQMIEWRRVSLEPCLLSFASGSRTDTISHRTFPLS